MALLAGVMLVSCVKIVSSLLRSRAEAAAFEELAALTRMQGNQAAQTPESEAAPGASGATEATDSRAVEGAGTELAPIGAEPAASDPESAAIFTRNLAPLFARNSDCIGWLSIADSSIDYPVMHTPQEPEKYLHLDFDGEYSASGVPFLQYNCSLDSDNLIIHGHNMKNGAMFRVLLSYREKSYGTAHSTIEFETARGLKSYSLYAVVQVPESDPWLQFVEAEDAADFSEQIAAIGPNAFYTIGEPPQLGQQLLTLSTCYGSNNAYRLLIIAVEEA